MAVRTYSVAYVQNIFQNLVTQSKHLLYGVTKMTFSSRKYVTFRFIYMYIYIYICEQVLFVRFTIIPPRLTDQCNFITVL